MSLQIVHYPHPTLRHVSKPLTKVDAQLRGWAAEMIELMYEHEGIGLAANQVDLPYRMFVINVTGDPEQPEHERVFLNPVLSKGKGQATMTEGCLSLPDIRGPMIRNTTVRVQAYDLAGNEIDETVDGMLARVIQHETDHLDGILFIDKMSPTEKAEVDDDLYELEMDFQSRQETGDVPSGDAIAARIAELEAHRC
ncbi:Peptide deformylase [Botrimarina colliarenosi]|uniref:Peptide deformylase n=1 Tax=Botrimarina colliarenosi TaxID=2528001 RepID=A0A5C6ACM7_9BACT|nr:peptide deformylase [Botrimarina colliarenosi]TWT96841.1 Peptide deformylase [Botrimarina colliarenosi]